MKTLPAVSAQGSFRFGGYLGARLDTICRARLLAAESRDRIYPETEEAFRRRVDDRLQPGRGLWQGEFWGKYMLSVVAAYRYYADDQLLDFAVAGASALVETQDADGYLGTYSDSTFMGPNTWNIWGRKYTLWALLEIAAASGDGVILRAATRLVDHLMGEVGPGKRDFVDTGQFRGLPSMSILGPIVMLYRSTHEQRFLDYANYIVSRWTSGRDGVPDLVGMGVRDVPIHEWLPDPDDWAKSYELVSCVEGLTELYEETGEERLLLAATNIHRQLVRWERSPVGSISFDDKFIGARFLRNTLAEICDVVYWNRLSHRLLLLTGEAHYADEIERSLFNSLLVAPSRDGSWGLRRLRLTHEHIEAHAHCSLEHHQCCVDNLPRGLMQASQAALFGNPDGISIGLYNVGRGAVRLADHTIVQVSVSGDYPYGSSLTIAISVDRPREFDVRLRAPSWAGGTLTVDGATQSSDDAGWVRVRRRWGSSSSIVLDFDARPRVEWFDPAANGPLAEQVRYHEERWPKLGYIDGGRHRSSLTVADTQPNERAGIVFCGPIALGIDRMENDVDPFRDPDLRLRLDDATRVAWKRPGEASAASVTLTDSAGTSLTMTPFDRLGATWDRRSEFTVWTVPSWIDAGEGPARDG